MLKRTLTAGALALTALACEPSLTQTAPPAAVVTAVFDPTKSQLGGPLPPDVSIP